MRFLKGLNDKFSGVRFQILLMDPLPPINQVFALMVRQERQLLSEGVEEPKVLAVGPRNSVAALGASSGSRKNVAKGQYSKGQKGSGKVCSFYGKSGHTVDTCFKKHSFPLNFKKGKG